jgi:uncharacterized protein (DUF427 family)
METKMSKGKEIRIPGPDHPITISPAEGKVRVTIAGRIVAESTRTLRLEEKGYPPVYYLPRADADMSLLVRTKHYSYCPYKGTVRTTAFPSAERNRNTRFGRTKSLMRQSPTSKSTWHFIPHGSMQSK